MRARIPLTLIGAALNLAACVYGADVRTGTYYRPYYYPYYHHYYYRPYHYRPFHYHNRYGAHDFNRDHDRSYGHSP
ncbi:MAG TPA: hypothetical protein VHL08_01820 [Dongiaceae bacterium]|nr:hypothetical protein [Dongiaceae bacterium]